MRNHNLSSHRVSRSLRVGLLSTTLLLAGGLLLLAGGLWHWHQNAAARSHLEELLETVALIPVDESESASLPVPRLLPVVEKQEQSAMAETDHPVTALDANEAVFNLTPSISEGSPTGEALLSFGSGSITQLPSLASKTEGGPNHVTRPEANEAVASPGSADPPVTITTGVVTFPGNSSATRVPSNNLANNLGVPTQSASVITVKSSQEVFSFTLVDTATIPSVGSFSPAVKMRIPAIDLVSDVTPLALLNHRGYWLFSSFKDVVGWIPNTGSPGGSSRGWYMGHNSQVFKRLPEVVDFIAKDKTVDIILETEKVAYLYRVAGRPVILTASEFNNGYFNTNLSASQSEIVLTTCVPPGKLDYRLLVTAQLVGQGVAPPAE